MKPAAALLALLLLAGCSKGDDLQPYAVVRRADVWQAVIRDNDRGRLARLSDAWTEAQADIAAAGATADLAALGPVADPTLASPAPLPAAGAFQCRIIRLGWRQGSVRLAPPVQAEAWAPCTLAADGILLRLETAPGVQRFAGTLYPDVDRLVFLGSVQLAGEPGRLRYGEDRDRDQLGVLTTLAPGHWRLALPWPRWSARLVLIEIKAG
ncbi:hypothetical protein CAP39_00210 [Sphingomonas sp. IBVSS1]|uniref:DUF4893 domain-containing protein n=1 Tax=Sandarakinorhabdus cyanobacteriorum TaxID=1981098 RepID=A0A255Y9Z9_9SPHN|nr:DUF4893 domain-containing protein [Sandarakinorhabdus cyanobacteriorum]OSZ71863.1 hypothetical protein CAP39_00210 [Sphingomonas sp. IBVSS1]OYQ26057.1 DUF4893 domain-containing protein [Sandarakinorhabdus cyanobacteriorum]